MSEKRPVLPGRLTSATLNQPDDPSVPLGEHPPGQDGEEIRHTPGSGPSIQDLLALAAITIMLVWPWAFFGAVWIRGGVQLSNHMAKVVINNPHATTYFVTLICSIIAMITGALFSLAIIRFAQELVTHRSPTRPFHLRVLLSFRHQTWPWRMKDAKYLIHRNRWWPAVLLIVCILTFPHLISSTTSLLAPIPFNRTALLTGTEINFAGGVDCQEWFNQHNLSNNCDYQLYNGVPYTSCLGENQMVDVLESGRGNILRLLTDNTQSLTFSQLGGGGGLHFLGPIQGILPIGPNGVPAFNTLERSPLSDPKIMAGAVSYDYVLKHQGLNSNVSCSYSSTRALRYQSLDPSSTLTSPVGVTYNASCSDQHESEVLSSSIGSFRSIYSSNLLGYWACQSATDADAYSIYLSGLNNYLTSIGNITCSVKPIQTAIYPVTYNSTTNLFTVGQPAPESIANITFPNLLPYALQALGEVISEGQNFQANLVAESILTFAYKFFNVPLHANLSSNFLRLFEQMIQGILEYEATYLRLIYSTVGTQPSDCNRTVTGSVNYLVVGWFVSRANIGFLIPITIINGAAFIALVIAMWIAWTGGHILHPFHPRPVIIAENVDEQEYVPDEWRYKVIFHPTTVLKEYFQKDVAANLKKGIKAVVHDVEKVGQELVAGPSDSHQEDSAPTNDKPEQDIAPASDDKLQENVAP